MKTTMDSHSETISFECEGFTLYGTLHLPSAPTGTGTGVILLNQGPLDRSGSHRLSMKLASRLTAVGIPVLRFDARGVGDSEGEWLEPTDGAPINALYKQIFDGAWLPDARAAVEFMMKKSAVDRVVLAGLCGGASTALHAGAQHPKVSGIAMVGMPIRLDAEPAAPVQFVESYIRSEAELYWRKLLRPAAWTRFLTFRTDYRTLWRVLSRRYRDLTRTQHIDTATESVSPKIRSSFAAAVKHKKQLLFVYPENDHIWHEFRELFVPLAGSPATYDLTTIPEANHTFTEPPWQNALLDSTVLWISRVAATRPA